MLPEENIDQLFRSALENAKEIPPANAWQGISNQLSNVSSVTQTVAAKSWFAKLGIVSKVAIIASVVITSVVAFELLKDETLNLSQNNSISAKNEISSNGNLTAPKDNSAAELNNIKTPNLSVNDVNKRQIQSQNGVGKGYSVYHPLSLLNKDLLVDNAGGDGDNLLNTIQSIVTDKIEVQKSKNESSTVLGNLIENGCKNKITLNVVESDSNGKLVQVNCNGNVKNSYLNYGDDQQLFFEGNSLSVIHFYKVNSRKDFYIKLVSIFSNGCKDSAMTKVEVSPSISMSEIMIPTVFTPNGDGKNDAYYVTIPEPKNFEMMVFDKGKKMIFSTTKFRDSWNGNCFGEPCVDGNYEVVIKTQYSGEKESVTTRWVNLNRNSNGN
ncbi:MAG: gliding motility-associated C-terminal domain-containing protein [Crocinitomicaceae bacterium]|nr:gliding motility-associated C-terminal domain-containing protein [Crocinitomicaceae bacterium]